MFYQRSLLASATPDVPTSLGPAERIDLGRGAWIDWASDWIPGSDGWFDRLRRDLPWSSHERTMYDRIVDVPRLMCSFDGPEDPRLPKSVSALSTVLGDAYRPIERISANWYRDGRDSVAFHPDRVPVPGDSLVAIVAVGERRPFLLRPLGGGPSRRFDVGRGDLLVMGGTTQALFEHSVPKIAHPAARISLMFRA